MASHNLKKNFFKAAAELVEQEESANRSGEAVKVVSTTPSSSCLPWLTKILLIAYSASWIEMTIKSSWSGSGAL